ncbi:MAG: calcium-binding protein, partial [Oscillatoria princeps RMCB-10]|nr:calcium-binding protein [Oscillatoria princeps RMCB-10]
TDTLTGGLGNDTIVVDIATDVVTEAAAGGTDLVQSSVSYTLGAEVENLSLTGTAAISGTGNTLNNTISGNAGSNTLSGGAGNDTLTGGLGSDRFLYDTAAVFASTAVGVDVIADFAGGVSGDKIILDKTTFTTLSAAAGATSLGAEFATVTTDTAAATSAADIVYNSVTGNLFYNQNGTVAGLGTGAQFAILAGQPVLAATDFIIQA